MAYYEEKARASRHSINFINQEFYPEEGEPRKIFLREIRLDIAPEFNCNYEKVFLANMAEFMKGDKRIKYDRKKELWSVE